MSHNQTEEPEKDALLSRRSYDRDAPEFESDGGPRSGDDLDTADDEGDVFQDDYEDDGAEESSSARRGIRGLFSKGYGKVGTDIPLQEKSRESRRASRRHRERLKRGEYDSEVVYNIEEGGQPSQSPSRESSEVDTQRVKANQGVNPAYDKTTRFRRVMLHLSIIAFFLALLYVAYQQTKTDREKEEKQQLALTLSNGTELFAPTTILISLDGFRADFLQRNLTPTLSQFINDGVSPLYMMPSFPSVTFPNHYTMVTGLYPEAHGIVGNTFWDPNEEDEFYYTHPQKALDAKWWGGEPVWLTAELQGIKTAIHMWPGSEANIGDVPPSHVDKYNGKEKLETKVDRILGLLDLPGPDSPHAMADNPRPQLIAAYVPNVDADGHKYGPNSTEIRGTISHADEMLAEIFTGIQERNLTDIVNVIVVSDHGMATTSTDRTVQLEDLLDVNEIEHVDGWPLFGLRLKDPSKTEQMYHQLKEKTKDMPHLHIYLRDKDMPERYHFSKNPRIAPLWIVPDSGWSIAPKSEFDVAEAKEKGLMYQPRGLHGYDYEHPLMRAIFVARGPAFPHPKGSRVDAFQNIELYNIVCDTLGIDPAPNNGTLRLPFKTTGHHEDVGAPQPETPYDPPPHGVGEAPAARPESTPVPSQPEAPEPEISEPATPEKPTPPTEPQQPTPPEQPGQPEEPKKGKLHKWWEWIAGTFEEAKKKLKGMFGNNKKEDSS